MFILKAILVSLNASIKPVTLVTLQRHCFYIDGAVTGHSDLCVQLNMDTWTDLSLSCNQMSQNRMCIIGIVNKHLQN